MLDSLFMDTSWIVYEEYMVLIFRKGFGRINISDAGLSCAIRKFEQRSLSKNDYFYHHSVVPSARYGFPVCNPGIPVDFAWSRESEIGLKLTKEELKSQ